MLASPKRTKTSVHVQSTFWWWRWRRETGALKFPKMTGEPKEKNKGSAKQGHQ